MIESQREKCWESDSRQPRCVTVAPGNCSSRVSPETKECQEDRSASHRGCRVGIRSVKRFKETLYPADTPSPRGV